MTIVPKYSLSNSVGTINLNDQSNYWVDAAGADFGSQQTTWSEDINYAGGANVQTQVLRGSLIPCTIPMWTQDTSLANVQANLAALWAVVDACGVHATTLTTDTETYAIVYSTRPSSIVRDNPYIFGFIANFVLVLMRQP